MPDSPVAVPPELAQILNGAPPTERERAWGSLVAKHSRLIMTVARTVAAEHDGVMDAYAFVLERLREDDYRRLRGYIGDGRSAFTTWLVVVARRMCVDHYRRRYGRMPRGDGDASAARQERASRRRLFDLASGVLDVAAIVDDNALTPDAELRVAQRDSALACVIDTLDLADRVLLKLRFEDDLPAREIATVLQMPSTFHVYRRLAVVYASLRRRLAVLGVESAAP
jgi:RNA polymerase sigma factor (sigma-70 family)